MNSGIFASGRGDQTICIGIPYPWFPHLRDIPKNCVECNGQNIDDTDSPLHGQQLPNLNAGFLLIGSTGMSGEVVGHDSVLLTVAHLPEAELTGAVDGVSAGTPAGTVSVGQGGAHNHTVNNADAQALTTSSDGAHTHSYDRDTVDPINASILALGTPVVENLITAATATTSDGAHSHGVTVPAHTHTLVAAADHNHSATFTGQALSAHSHNVTLHLNAGAQQAIDLTPKAMTCRWIIRIK